MKNVLVVLGVIVLILFVVGGSLAATYNRLVGLNEAVQAQWAQVENQLQRRWDLIPNLVETVKGYAAHEQEIFIAIAEARAKLAGGTTVQEKVEAASQLESALARLLVIVENYPELKADKTFIRLQDELTGTENRLATERMRFNDKVQEFNVTIKRFPTVILARLFGFAEKAYFEITDEARQKPQVKF